jgi:MYXO-CTERM domain-containing protein
MVLTFAALTACAASPDDLPTAAPQAVAIPGPWVIPAAVNAIGDRQYVAYNGSPLIAAGGRCTSSYAFDCSCMHPACSAGLPGTLELAAFLRRRFPQIRGAGGFDCCRQNTGDPRYLSVHSIGRALDLSIPQVGSDADNTAGDAVAHWLVEHAQEIGVQIVIWDRSSWRAERPAGSKLQPYTGPIAHTDHIHMELNLAGANRQTPFFTSGASQGGATCTPRCDGTRLVSATCGVGDCAAFGTACLADPTPRCGTPGCPRTGTAFLCLDRTRRMECRDGVMAGVGDCGAFGSYCSTAGVAATAARCVLSLCVSGPDMVPERRTQCSITPGRQLECLADGGAREVACPAGQVCSMVTGAARCEPPSAACPVPAAGGPVVDRAVCYDARTVARCFNGNLYSATTCGANGACSTLGGVAHCAQRACIDARGQRRSGDVCTPAGLLARCDAEATFTNVRRCPAGQACTEASGVARCVVGTGGDDDDDLPGGVIDGGAAPDVAVAADAMATDASPADAIAADDAAPDLRPAPGCACSAPPRRDARGALALVGIALALVARRRRDTHHRRHVVLGRAGGPAPHREGVPEPRDPRGPAAHRAARPR